MWLLYVRMLESSTNPIAVVVVLPVLSNGRRVEAKNRNRIGERVDPWGMPVVCGLGWSVYSPIFRHVVLSWRKDLRNPIR